MHKEIRPTASAVCFDGRDLMEQAEKMPVGHYVIFYQPTEDSIDVVRILHGSRDIMIDDVGTAD